VEDKMPIAISVPTSNDYQRTTSLVLPSSGSDSSAKVDPIEVSKDVLEISQKGLTKQKAENRNDLEQTSFNDKEKSENDKVSVRSTIGRAKSSGSISSQQASDLYNKIANLL